MSYELKDYLNAINHKKENLMDTDDEMWENLEYWIKIITPIAAKIP